MKLKAVIPVLAPYRVEDDAAQHLARAQLCGIDFWSYTGQAALLSMLDGVVEFVNAGYTPEMKGDYDSLGRFIVVRAIIGTVPVWIRYCHNEVFECGRGMEVKAGDRIGRYGSTGLSTGPHVHVDFWVTAEYAADAAALGLVNAGVYDRSPWPGSPVMQNVNPTKFLADCGLDVVNSRKGA